MRYVVVLVLSLLIMAGCTRPVQWEDVVAPDLDKITTVRVVDGNSGEELAAEPDVLIAVLSSSRLSTTDQARHSGYGYRIDISDGIYKTTVVVAGDRVQIDGTYYQADENLTDAVRGVVTER